MEKKILTAQPLEGQPPIVAVDDDRLIRKILLTRLQAAGYVVEVASDGLAGLEMARRLRPDVILTDWVMPGMDGLGLIQEVRADSILRSAYVILLTSRDSGADRVSALDCGADEHLAKPWSDEELLARIRTGLRIRGMQRELMVAERKAALTMAATMGHEINNPLTVLSGCLQILRQQRPVGVPATELLDRCEAQIERLARVAAALRNLKEPETTAYLKGVTMLNLEQARLGGASPSRPNPC
jgi:DNA-binding response OmpR family regulator